MTPEELRIVAWTLLGEAAGEGNAGMTAVAHVIRNRALSGRFPENPATVALQANQFSTWNAITNGGNLPRARYPVGSTDFERALEIVAKVFSATPGKDPTQGATHYYAPQGMAGGSAPYWWRSEATRGEKKIGNHIFAVRYSPKEAPTPVSRSYDFVGSYPSAGQLEVFRTGAPLQLPVIGPTGGPSLKEAPVPARMSVAMQEKRLSGGDTSGATYTDFIYDPVTQALRPKTAPISDMVRAAQKSNPTQPAKSVQRIAGFAVPSSGSMESVDRARLLASQTPTYAGNEIRPKKVTQFAQPAAQPAGSINPNKDQSQLGPQPPIPEIVPPVQSGGLSRDAIAARAAGVQAAKALAVPKPRPIPKPAPAPLRIVVQRDPIAAVIRKPVSAVQSFKDQGMTAAQAYDAANAAAAERARNNAGPSGYSVITSGDKRYDATTGNWV